MSSRSIPPLYVGLTGNIAAGKSEVARLLEDLGATIIDADLLARLAVEPGTPAYEAVLARWGASVLRDDGTIDRAALRDIVFRNRAELDALNAIVHPEVARLRQQHFDDATQRGDAIVIYMVPLLFEANMTGEFDCVILVDAPDAVRLDRLMQHRGLSRDEAARMIAAQMPAHEKRSRADLVIDNSGSLAELRDKVGEVWTQLSAHVSKPASSHARAVDSGKGRA
jgi:dephospho-CoA kinase